VRGQFVIRHTAIELCSLHTRSGRGWLRHRGAACHAAGSGAALCAH
jgi:hypothetical protein